ncbi:hypothetical protein FRACA_100041 [Frankia canadensis]|uniref:Uncharacterized protein n=1 Tax=Frankia canadensis TaxID=1836972 RepID=A0A2I2KII7_9ACTN|nr:hypothetical protein FRACA_100041 [Frankia canadensis]SOU52763.1 hypothetical protein FRACA_100041 [Frankia canadensis]
MAPRRPPTVGIRPFATGADAVLTHPNRRSARNDGDRNNYVTFLSYSTENLSRVRNLPCHFARPASSTWPQRVARVPAAAARHAGGPPGRPRAL